MNEVYKFSSFLLLVLVLSCVFTDYLAVGLSTFALVLIYYYFWDYYTEPGALSDGVANLCLKVRNLKSNDYWADRICATAEMNNSTGSSNFLYGPRNPLFGRSNSSEAAKKTEPAITSTPISYWQRKERRLFTPPKPTLNHSRYSLSDMNNSLSPKNLSNVSLNQSVQGPLLTSTSFHNNVSTYLDSKSPGLSQRLVQYSNESELRATHQAKYGRPGVFPIVHLNKKDKSERTIQPKQVKIRITKPDYPTYASPEHHKLLMDGIIQDPIRPDLTENGTRSVLDALKEISRKRILANEVGCEGNARKLARTSNCGQPNGREDAQDVNKRQRGEFSGGLKEQKRRREETSPYGSDVESPTSKKGCFVDAVTASYLSTKLHPEAVDKGKKRKATEVSEHPHKKDKKISKTNAETQTAVELDGATPQQKETEVESKTKVDAFTQSDNEISVQNDDRTEEDMDEEEEKVDEEPPNESFKVFDEGPLEISRKNKLLTLLSVITGDKPQLIPDENRLKTYVDSQNKEEEIVVEEMKPEEPPKQIEKKSPVSILSPQNKPKHDKHVTFSLPNDTEPPPEERNSTVDVAPKIVDFTTNPMPSAHELLKSTPTFNFPVPAPLDSKTTPPAPFSTPPPAFTVTEQPKLVSDPPKFNFTPSAPKSPISAPTQTNAPKLGGFKFDLKTTPPKTPTTIVSTPESLISDPKEPTFALVKPTTTASSPFKLPTMTASQFAASKSSPTTPKSMFSGKGGPSSKPFAFATEETDVSKSLVPSASATFLFDGKTSETQKPFAGFQFSSSVSKDVVVTTATDAKKTFSFFGPTSAEPKTTTTTSSVSTSIFGSKPVAVLGTTASQMNIFGTPKTASASFVATTTTNATNFGSNTTFGASKEAAFGTNTTSAPIFGAFGNTTTSVQSPFTTNSTNSMPPFGTSTTNVPSGFGNASSGFTATTTPSFGFGNVPKSTPAAFGSTNTGFGTPTTAPPSFGSATANLNTTFGQNPKTPTFNFNVTTASAPSFGTATASLSFGTNTTHSSAPSFGAPAKSAPIFSFGSTENKVEAQTSGFGGGFGTAAVAAPFGGQTSFSKPPPSFPALPPPPPQQKQESAGNFGPFNTTNFPSSNASFNPPNAFAGDATKPGNTFGAPSTNAFGSSANFAAPNMFSGTNPNQAPFAFKPPENQQQQPSKLFSFGSGEAAKSGFNFSAGAPMSFGGGSSGGFGATSAPFGGSATSGAGFGGSTGGSFGVGSFTPQFNAPTAGTFSIGTGAAPSKARTQLKAKRRT